MNGITHLNLYPALNMVAVKGAVSVFNSAVASNAFAALPGLHERVMRAQLLINSHSRSLVDQAIALEASLSSAGISDLAGQYKVIAEDSSLAPRLKAKGIEDLNAFCQERLRHVVQKVEAAQGLIEANRAEIGALTLDHFAGDLIDYDEARLTALVTREAALKATGEQLQADWDAIKAANELLETDFWKEHIKKTLPTAEELQMLVSQALVPKFDVEIIKLGLQRLETYLDIFGAAAKLVSLGEALVRLSKNISANNLERQEVQEKIKALQARKEKFESYDGVLTARTQWVEQVGLVVESLVVFLRECRLFQTADGCDIASLQTHLTTFISVLRQVRV
ncbi:alpha-xenorhabdolysin family binary toxin subunit B [Pseudomonas lundensis]|uniref:alpha-xenorhabdolysin family binary toxin subunit B n=2 Tax=Pseudomonas lundensis TaxID=86185 RepID=UPI00117A726C|nr:alpha-xenorhabdolysin family binary toxin subunit B [Pseudomonas lundensis]